jgi:hypothetical protein
MSDTYDSLLIIGGPDTGKTHYGGQLLGRLNQGKGQIKRRGASANIAPFEEVLRCLGQGVTAGHTATDVYHEIILPIELTSGDSVDLVFPDYGGEQIKAIMEYRQITKAWRGRLIESAGWLLFIRPERIHAPEDILTRPRPEAAEQKTEMPTNFRWSDQAYYVELLQMLLYAKSAGTTMKIKNPALTIVLSCWDELNPAATRNRIPNELLGERMPLFAEFINANWESEDLLVLGLSSLGKALKEEEPDEGYLDNGPENFGYVVLPDTTHSSDLTLPVSLTMERIA